MQRVGLYKEEEEAEKDMKYFEAIEKDHELYPTPSFPII